MTLSDEEYNNVRQNGFHETTYALPVIRSEWNKYQKNKNYKFSDKNWRNMKIIKDNFCYEESFVLTSDGHILYDHINKFILEAHQSGLIQYHISRYDLGNDQKEEDSTEILTLYMLSAGFIVWLVAVLIACLSFIGEHFYHSRKEIIDYESEEITTKETSFEIIDGNDDDDHDELNDLEI
jgi:hypothetical protein